MLKKKVPMIYMLVAALLWAVASVIAIEHSRKADRPASPAVTNMMNETQGSCDYDLARLTGYHYIHPLYLAERTCESGSFITLKSQIDAFVQNMKSTGDLFEASVYLKDLNSGDWMDYDPAGTYEPGSLFKVVAMITIFRMAEKDPTLFEKEITFNQNDPAAPTQTFNSEMIQRGTKYKVKDLLRYMVVHSDNNATSLLNKVMDVGIFTSVFSDLGLRKPKKHEFNYTMSVKEYSRFMSVLYDGGYLTIPASEIATSLLSECVFDQGIKKLLPKDVMVAHKFGESGQPNNRQLHESAIVYLNERPYLLTIMTRGISSEKLAEMISELSRMTYEHMIRPNN